MQDAISELRLLTRITTSFWYDILCVLTCIPWKLQLVYRRSTYRMTYLLQRYLFSGLELDCGVMAPNMQSSLLLISHLCLLTCTCITSKVIQGHSAHRMTALQSVFLWYNTVCKCRMPVPYDWILHFAFTAKDAFTRTKLASYTTHNVIPINLVH